MSSGLEVVEPADHIKDRLRRSCVLHCFVSPPVDITHPWPVVQSSGESRSSGGRCVTTTISPKGEIEGCFHGLSGIRAYGATEPCPLPRRATLMVSLEPDHATSYDSDPATQTDASRYTLDKHAIDARPLWTCPDASAPVWTCPHIAECFNGIRKAL